MFTADAGKRRTKLINCYKVGDLFLIEILKYNSSVKSVRVVFRQKTDFAVGN